MNDSSPRLPSRYEDLDTAFRGRLRPDRRLLDEIQRAHRSMKVSGGVRFLPIYGRSGSGKTSSAAELGTHLPDVCVVDLPRHLIEDRPGLEQFLAREVIRKRNDQRLIVLIDQYEETSAQREAVPTRFVEAISLLDRGELRNSGILFIWLTTSREFQAALADATSRNARILQSRDFEISGPPKDTWPSIVEETFRFHNEERALADFALIEQDLGEIANESETIGLAIERTGERLHSAVGELQDLSTYQVIMLWPVTDGLRITRVQQFTHNRQGYRLDWNAWYQQLNPEDQKRLPLREYNRARLYFDVRLIPIAAADLQPLCKDLDDDNDPLHSSYLKRFEKTHFASLVRGEWSSAAYAPLRERDSQRAKNAQLWYETVNQQSTKLGRRIARCLRELGLDAEYEQEITTKHTTLRADILVKRAIAPQNVIVEIKAFSASNTMPSTICQQIKITLRRHAQLAGFLAVQ